MFSSLQVEGNDNKEIQKPKMNLTNGYGVSKINIVFLIYFISV